MLERAEGLRRFAGETIRPVGLSWYVAALCPLDEPCSVILSIQLWLVIYCDPRLVPLGTMSTSCPDDIYASIRATGAAIAEWCRCEQKSGTTILSDTDAYAVSFFSVPLLNIACQLTVSVL